VPDAPAVGEPPDPTAPGAGDAAGWREALAIADTCTDSDFNRCCSC
jgi:hypothetical protein